LQDVALTGLLSLFRCCADAVCRLVSDLYFRREGLHPGVESGPARPAGSQHIGIPERGIRQGIAVERVEDCLSSEFLRPGLRPPAPTAWLVVGGVIAVEAFGVGL